MHKKRLIPLKNLSFDYLIYNVLYYCCCCVALDPWFQHNTLPSSQQKVNEQEWNEFVEFSEKCADQIMNKYQSHHGGISK